jgi:NAD(P)-dependent dehydrogenase (short-subunit alcohol dehydrogenase family)
MQVGEYFQNKSCVVTGAASGIGFALTEALLQAGGVVLMADRDTKTLDSAVEQLGAYAGQVHSMSIDVTNQDQVQHMVENTASRHGRLDILFNNAGIGGTLPFGDVTLEHWRRIIDLNLWGVIYGIHFALPIMRKQGERFEQKPPADAIPAAEAARTILVGVANQEGIIALPESARSLWRQYGSTPGAAESVLLDLARQRRSSYQSKGRSY